MNNSNFDIGDWVYGDDWCYGQITDMRDGCAVVEFETPGGGGSFCFELDELRRAPEPNV